MASSEDQDDTALLSSLGACIVDREQFEQQFINRLEQQFPEAEPGEQDAAPANTETDEVVDNQVEENSSTELPPLGEDEEKKTCTTSSSSQFSNDSSILQRMLQSKKDKDDEERIKNGEMTPFGNTIEKPSSSKIDTSLDFFKYLQSQKTLNKQFQTKRDSTKKQKSHGRNQQEKDDSDSRSSDPPRLTKKRKLKAGNTALNMNILFPKKKPKKARLGTEESEDPRDARRRPGKSFAETTAMSESEESEYIPSESEESEAGLAEYGLINQAKPKRQSGQSRKLRDEDYNSDEEYESDHIERPYRKSKKEADDGNINFYKKRIQDWKEQETRLNGEFHKLDSEFKLPTYLWESLYKYQKIGVKWLWELHLQRSGGILGDEMGLGKTIQVIVFLAGLVCSNRLGRYSEYRGLGPSLIICPATVMHQWVKEFHIWWPACRVAVMHESGSYSGTRQTLIQSIQTTKGILITTYAGLVNNQKQILKHSWHYVIVDEGHKIRNPDAQVTLALKQVATPHRIILSGSPLQNNLKELWSLFDFIYPGKLGTLPIFMEQFAVPITQGGYSNASDIQVAAAYKCATILRNLISPYLLRRMKSDVNKHINLPSKNEQVLFCKLTQEQRELYLQYISSKEISSIVKGNGTVFVGLINLRKICNHPHLFDGGPKVISKTAFGKEKEAMKIMKKRIPKNKVLDVANFVEDEGSDIELNPTDSFGHWSKCGKMIVIKTLLKLWKDQKHKVLLFTQSRQMLCILENFVRQEGYSYLRLDGGTSIGSRQPLITKFNEDPDIFVFLLTTRVGGLGVNLTGANRVILFDPDWNPSTDLQARERAWRIGQERQVTIYRLITSGTIEEKIYHRQIFKQFLTNRVLKDPKQRRFFKSNDMLELFTYNEGTGGTESEAIFAGTGSRVKVPSKAPKEKASGKLRRVPNLVKQRPFKPSEETEPNVEVDEEDDKVKMNKKQDAYVLAKLFRRSGVESALRHDRIMDTNEADYLLVEKEAEKVARDAIKVLKQSRRQCWAADSGKVSWTGTHGQLNQQPKPMFGPKNKQVAKPVPPESDTAESSASFFSKPQLQSSETTDNPITSVDLIALIRARNAPLIHPQEAVAVEDTDESSLSISSEPLPNVKEEHIELLRDIREFIAFRAMIDGQAGTNELIAEFGNKLPPEKSPLFKQMLSQLCTHRQVDGQRLWRLKPEFR